MSTYSKVIALTDRQMDTQTDRQIDTQTGRQTDRWKPRQTIGGSRGACPARPPPKCPNSFILTCKIFET